MPVEVKLTIDKQNPDDKPRVMINEVKSLDEAIASHAAGIIIYLNNSSAVAEIKRILSADKRGANKVYFVPDVEGWDIKIDSGAGFAFYDAQIISKLRAVSGVTNIKEI